MERHGDAKLTDLLQSSPIARRRSRPTSGSVQGYSKRLPRLAWLLSPKNTPGSYRRLVAGNARFGRGTATILPVRARRFDPRSEVA
jgi:hypothetical protein